MGLAGSYHLYLGRRGKAPPISKATNHVGEIPYLPEFSDHVNALEIEHLEYFKQLDPVNEPPVVISDCLATGPHNGTLVVKRWNPLRRLAKYLDRKIDEIRGKPPEKPVYAKYCAATDITIAVYYHVVVGTDANLGLVTRKMITDQVSRKVTSKLDQCSLVADSVLDRYYNKLHVRFVEIDLNYRIHSRFAVSPKKPEDSFKRFTRSGDYSSLNVWVKQELPELNGVSHVTSQLHVPGILTPGYPVCLVPRRHL